MRFVNIGGRSNEMKGEVGAAGDIAPTLSTLGPSNTSYRNEEEANEIIQLLKQLLRQDETDIYQGSIGIVTPYSSQVSLIKSMIAQDEELREMARAFPQEIEVKSIE